MTPQIKQRIEQIRRGEVPEGYIRNSSTIIPSGWEKNVFSALAIIASGLIDPKQEPYCHMKHIGPENIEKNTGRILETPLASELGLISGKFHFDSKSIVYSKIRPNLNKVCAPEFEGICSADCYSITPTQAIRKHYLLNLMLSHDFYKRAVACSMRTGMPKINQDDLNIIPMCYPSDLVEQERIEKILTVQDKLIALKEKLIEEKKRQKKYLMQQLLTGKKRLPGFSGDRVSLRLKQVAERITRKNAIANNNVLTISAQYGLINQFEFFDKEIASEDKSNYYLLMQNEFAYNKSYSANYPFGAIKKLTRYDMGIVSPLYICFRIVGNEVSTEYTEHYFEAGLMNSEIQSFAQEGARNHGLLNISVEDFFQSKIVIPPYEEQIAIAKILSSIAQEIDLLQQTLEQEKQKKKALMQLLLTGIVRV